MGVTKYDPALHAYTAKAVLALTHLMPLMTNMKSSWSNNFKAKLALQQKTQTLMEIATIQRLIHVNWPNQTKLLLQGD